MRRTFIAITLASAMSLGTVSTALACGDDHQDASKAVPAGAQAVALKVKGMTCGGCANEIRNALLKVDGIYDAAVDFDTGVAKVQFDGAKLDAAKISAAIAKAGFTVVGPEKG